MPKQHRALLSKTRFRDVLPVNDSHVQCSKNAKPQFTEVLNSYISYTQSWPLGREAIPLRTKPIKGYLHNVRFLVVTSKRYDDISYR